MNIDKNPEQLKELLVSAYHKNYNWVYYSGTDSADRFVVYKEHDTMLKDQEYGKYKPIIDVLKVLDPEKYGTAGMVNTTNLENVLKHMPIMPLNFGDDLRGVLAIGSYCPVNYTKTVLPDEVSKFNIYEHTHAGHQVYESGHEVNLTGSFADFKDALNFFNKKVSQLNKDRPWIKPDLQLLASFKDVDLLLNSEGYPQENTGLVLKNAIPWFQNNKFLSYKQMDHCDFGLAINQPMLARYNVLQNKMDFVNTNFETVDPNRLLPYSDLSSFSSKPVVVSNYNKLDLNEQKINKDKFPKLKP